MDRTVPTDILRLIDKAAAAPLTAAEARALTSYVSLNMEALDPTLVESIAMIVDEAEADPNWDASALTPSTAPSVSDQVNAAYANQVPVAPAGIGGLVAGAVSAIPGLIPDWYHPSTAGLEGPGFGGTGTSAAAAPLETPTLATDPAFTYDPGGGDIRSQAAGLPSPFADAPVTADPVSLVEPDAPDRGGRRDRRRERGGTDWSNELARSLSTDTTAPGSAFEGISYDHIGDVLENPGVAARLYAESRGGGETYAAGIEPYLGAATEMAQMGYLDRGRGDLIGRGHSPGYALSQAEDWLNQMNAMGTEPDARGIYRDMFKRAERTPIEAMDTGTQGHEAGDIANQIAVTNGALLAGKEFMTPIQHEGLQIRLDRAAREYMLGVAKGDPQIADMTYPEYLRSIKAQRWLGR